jgi:uncharacterized protein (TIRG00374 family)
MRKKIIRIIALVSLALFIAIFIKIGPSYIWQNLKKISWEKLAVLIVMRLLYWSLRTVNWRMVFTKLESTIPFWHLFWVRLAGHAVGYLTPSAKIGGEAVRVLMVDEANKKKVLASVTLDKTIELLATILLVMVGVVLAIMKIAMPDTQKVVFVLLAILVCSLAIFLFNKQRKSFFIWLIDSLKKVKIKFKYLEKKRDKIRETDAHIADFYSNHKKTFFYVFALYVLLVLFWTFEIYLTFLFIGAEHVTYLTCFLIVTLGTFSFIMPAIPAAIGIYEITYISLVTLMGIKIEFGMAMVLMRRLLGLFSAGVGLIPILKKGRFQDFVVPR